MEKWSQTWTDDVYRHESKMSSSKYLPLPQSLETGDTVSHVGIFDPAL